MIVHDQQNKVYRMRFDLLAQLTHQGPDFNYNKEHIAE